MTYVGAYINREGISVITDSQGTMGDRKDDRCQKLFLVGNNLMFGTGWSDILQGVALSLHNSLGYENVPIENSHKQLMQSCKEFAGDRQTNVYICGAGREGYQAYGVMIGPRLQTGLVEKIVVDGSGSPFVIEALTRDMSKGIDHMAYDTIEEAVSFMYDTGIEGARSIGVDLHFQLGFISQDKSAALYEPDTNFVLPPAELVSQGDYMDMDAVHSNAARFGELISVLKMKHDVIKGYNQLNQDIWYDRGKVNSKTRQKVMSMYMDVNSGLRKIIIENLGMGNSASAMYGGVVQSVDDDMLSAILGVDIIGSSVGVNRGNVGEIGGTGGSDMDQDILNDLLNG